MLVKTITGVTAVQDVQIQKPINKLLIVKQGTVNTIQDERLTLMVGNGQGTEKKIAVDVRARDLANISQFGAGYNYQAFQTAANLKCAFVIDLTHAGALPLSDNRYLSVSATGLESAATYLIYGLELHVLDTMYNEFSTTVIAGTEPQSKVYNCSSGEHLLCLVNNRGFSQIRLKWSNGVEVAYTLEEALALQRELNELTLAPDTLVEGDTLNQTIMGGGGEMIIFPLSTDIDHDGTFERVITFEINTTGTAECRFIKVESKHL